MGLQIGQALADFEHPLQMIGACHQRIETQCETLRKLAAHLPLHGCDAEAQQAASNVMRYFDSAGRHHREDEECDLFPRLAACAAGRDAERVASLVRRLKQEHHEIERAWLRLREALETIAHGESAPLDEAEIGRFCDTYRAHMALEDADLIPLAELLLDADDQAALGRAMAARRGIIAC
ncbi:MAG: hemerythrin domain-containing protein [Burkholderiales bacterium]